MKKSLFETNPYLKDAVKYRDMLITSVASSTAIETGASVEEIKKQLSDCADKYLHPSEGKPEFSS